MDILLGIGLGVGLSACCGFRIFVPLLVSGLAAYFQVIPTSPEFAWLASEKTLIMFGTATLVEIVAYYIPWLDNLLDTIAAPLSVGAGTVVSASFLGGADPMVQWVMALIVGGGSAGVVHASTSLIRLGSTASTGGLANPIVSTFENFLAFVGSILSLFIPFIMAGLVLVGLIFGIRKLRNRKKTPKTS